MYIRQWIKNYPEYAYDDYLDEDNDDDIDYSILTVNLYFEEF